ncbi:M24 family metallopeptidase [Aeromicrobium fastidiosum]|uniref:Aminopeptidase P family protein n=1 Tax=Aeromicrobium fastidiosum TaxID=52699 RepID=A0A641AK06_9ACTN|nr:Xaa-Pro peptidase family protein [Aeromicrobium fastidiosum]KAA1376167.1 aminopeptidase P family protein [Aeromicrobium fastidiosum]MBP2391947.1 Xaa-Pro aminopeptidase [Aeromicrobium fastidiosum]
MTAATRRAALVEALVAEGLEGLFVTTLVNVRYLTGFTGSNGALVVPVEGDPVFLTDGRYRDQAAAELPDVDHLIGRDLIGTAATRMTSGAWGLETHTLSVDGYDQLADKVGDVDLMGTDRLVERLREVKDADEIDALTRACDISTRALEQLLEGPLVGRTERDVARDLENRMFALGAEAIAFETILATGDHTAVPHHHPTDRVLATGDLLKIDFGARVDGYHADCTRTVVLGRADDWQREVHAAVRASQAAGLDLLRDGVDVSASDAAARASLEASGWLDAFTTGLGHGVGLEIHEDPFIASSHAGKLSSRTVLTMEPGIYVPGRGGVRIEDTVLVTAGAPEVLTTMTKDLLEIG